MNVQEIKYTVNGQNSAPVDMICLSNSNWCMPDFVYENTIPLHSKDM